MLRVGNQVRVRTSKRSPYAGKTGVLVAIDESDSLGPYLVKFEDAVQFRYQPDELEAVEARGHGTHGYEPAPAGS